MSNDRWVPATVPRKRRHEAVTIDATAISTPDATVYIDAALEARDGAAERTSGKDRSVALIIRMAPFTGVWLVLAAGVAWAAQMGAAWALIVFSMLTAVTYGWLDRQERQFSRNGLERHRIDTLADLKHAEMEHTQELRKMALAATLKQLEAKDRDRYD